MPFFGELHPRGAAPRCPPSAGPRDPRTAQHRRPLARRDTVGSKQGKRGESLLVCAQGGKGFPMPKNPDCRCCTPSKPRADSCGQGLSGARLC